MPKIYEYFGFIFFFYSNDHEPIHVHVSYSGNESKVIFTYENGALKSIKFVSVEGKTPIPLSKHKDVEDFIKVYNAHIVSKWTQFYIFKQKPFLEKITKKVKP